MGNRVKIISGVANEDLPALYQRASVFVFPSLFEGFGAPVLEALFSKVPVIASRGGAIEEAGGQASVFIDPTSAAEIGDALLRVISDSALRKEMVDSGYLHAQSMTDKVFADKTMAVYKSVLKK